MKLFIAISAVLFVVLADENGHHHHDHHGDVHGLDKVHKNCQNNIDTQVDNEIFEKLSRKEPVDLPSNFGKHMLCMMQGAGMVTSDGKIDKEGIKTHIHHVIHDEAKVTDILSECAVAKSTPEQTSIDLDACLRKTHVLSGPVGGDHGHGHGHSHH